MRGELDLSRSSSPRADTISQVFQVHIPQSGRRPTRNARVSENTERSAGMAAEVLVEVAVCIDGDRDVNATPLRSS